MNDAQADLGHGRDVLQVFTHIQSDFFIPGVIKMITTLKKSCPGCIKLNKIPFTAFEADVPDVHKSIQPPFTYCQADIFGPVLAHKDDNKTKRWSLVILCLSSQGVHLEILHNYSAQSITFALRGIPRIIWIDTGLNIVKAGKDLVNTEMKVISNHNLKFTSIEFRVTLTKHHAGIGAVERIIGSIKNTVNKSLTGPHQLIMDDEELITWTHGVIEKPNNRPLILKHHLASPSLPTTFSKGLESVSETRSTLQHQSTDLKVECRPQHVPLIMGAGVY